MKNSVKLFLFTVAVLVFSGCRKSDLSPVSPQVPGSATSYRSFHEGDPNTGNLFTDKDKCKKCHTGGREMNTAFDVNTINSISAEDLILIHRNSKTISDADKTELIQYLQGFNKTSFK